MKRKELNVKSILLVDDTQESLDLYSSLLEKRTGAHVVKTRHPSVAIKLAEKHFFDVVLIDVTMNYNGTQFGGLEVYKSLKSRYGDSSLIVYSQYITDDLLRQYHYDEFNFLEKREDPKRFIEDCVKMVEVLRTKQSCFIAMPFAKTYSPVFEAIKKSMENTLYRCVRIDEREFTKSIVEKIFLEIQKAKLVIFLATGKNPNAFYECGYAVALNKEVITLTDYFENLPFDIKDRNAISYGDDLEQLIVALKAKLLKITDIPSQ